MNIRYDIPEWAAEHWKKVENNNRRFVAEKHSIFIDHELDDNETSFFEAFENLLRRNSLDPCRLEIFRYKNKRIGVRYILYNYNAIPLGSIKLTGRKTQMLMVTQGDILTTEALENQTLSDYIQAQWLWIKYIKQNIFRR